jgi:eukaryotic-like serine/threonine-protein kinase
MQNKPAHVVMSVGPFTVLDKIARGGTAGVYLAEHTSGKRVALKVLDPFFCSRPEIVERMLGEHEISRRARHPGLLEIDLAERSPEGVPYLVMELIDGENLGSLADREYVSMDAILAIGAQVAAAIASMHAAGTIHCDLKPDNVMLLFPDVGTGPKGWPRAKVIDFGVSRIVEQGPFDDTTIAGTPSYMAPEQWRGAPSTKSDVYGLGCMLYELVVGEPPFHGPLPHLMAQHSGALAVRPSTLRGDVPAELDRLIMRALSKDEGMRPTMRDMAVALANLLDELVPARKSESAELVRISS